VVVVLAHLTAQVVEVAMSLHHQPHAELAVVAVLAEVEIKWVLLNSLLAAAAL
jgi:hypothetical protein